VIPTRPSAFLTDGSGGRDIILFPLSFVASIVCVSQIHAVSVENCAPSEKRNRREGLEEDAGVHPIDRTQLVSAITRGACDA
jgi:hypothetical protein